MITLTAPDIRRVVLAAVPPAPSRKDRVFSAMAAFALHGLLIFGGGALFVQPAEYGVDAGESGIDVELVAAPSAALESVAPPPASAPVIEAAVEADAETVVQPEPIPVPPAPEVQAQKIEPVSAPVVSGPPAGVVGDGSSSVPGRDATTFRSRAGAVSALPSYLKNPAPRYPEAARQAGQQGVVLLRVEISPAGKAEEVSVRQGSGFALLDDAAVSAVRKWKFRSAKAGGISVNSSAEIPIRFQLDASR